MSAASAAPAARPRRWLAVAGLLALYAALSFSASLQKGVSFDEAEQLAVGYNVWTRHDFRMESGNGDFVKRWATLPYLLTRPRLPGTDDPNWRQGEPYMVGYHFFFSCGNRPESLLLQARAMAALLGVGLGLLVFRCSRALFGWNGGLLSLAVFAFSPHMLAFGALVSTEMSICLGLLGSTVFAWKLLHRVSWPHLAGSLGFVALLVLAKPSALAILPVAVVLLVVRVRSLRPLEWRLGTPLLLDSPLLKAGVFSGLVLLHAIVGWGAIWAHYEFRYLASPTPADPGIVFRPLQPVDPVGPFASAFIQWSARTHFLPQGLLYQAERLLARDELRPAFLHGRWKFGGWRGFFPYAMAVKTAPAFALLLALGLAGWWWRRRDPGAPLLYDATPFLALAAVYFAIAVAQPLNIGHRHVLPVYPPLYVLAGAAAWAWAARPGWLRRALVALLAWLVVESTLLWPHYLAYFSPLAGGPRQGYRHLVDSSLDWGMDLPGLKTWLARHNPAGEPFFLAYFGTDEPDYYRLGGRRLPGFFELRPRPPFAFEPGIYAVSASLLQSVYTQPFGPWNRDFELSYQASLQNVIRFENAAHDPAARAALLAEKPAAFWDAQYADYDLLRFARLCAWLRHHQPPDDSVGYSILIWRLGAAALHDALYGPPAELYDAPVRPRHPQARGSTRRKTLPRGCAGSYSSAPPSARA